MRSNNLVLFLVFLLLASPFAAVSAGGRSQWNWGVIELMNNPTKREHVLNLWESQGIDTGYFWIDLPTLQSNPQAYRSLIADVHARGMRAIALDGDPSFVLPGAPHAQAIARFQSVLDYNAANAVNEQFDGAHFDNEPWALSQWNTDMAGTIQQYLTLSSEYIQMRDAAGSSMTVGADVAFILAATQFPEINNTPWQSVTKPTYKHVQDIYDTVTLMDYRDFALGVGGIVFHAQPWLDYGDAIGKPVEIGIDTLGPQLPEKVSFFEEGNAFMEAELALAEAQFLPRPSFDGFAIHYLGSYEPLLLAEATPGDFNLDTVVDQLDLNILQDHFGQTGQFWTQGDSDLDGVVSGQDFLTWQRNVTNVAASSLLQVPEPDAVVVTLMLLLVVQTKVRVRRVKTVSR